MKNILSTAIGSKASVYAISLGLFLLVNLSALSVFGEPYQCDVNGDDTLGIEEAIYVLQSFSGALTGGSHEILDCGDPNFEIAESGNLSTKAKRYILCRMNEIRSQVALGMIADDDTDEYWPVAANMTRMQWDKNLATVAQNYANECNYGHNSSRGTDYAALTDLNGPAVGENIAARWSSRVTDSSEALTALETAFTGWNGENDLWHYDTINTESWNTGFGHFTQHVWADTTRVGCGQAWCLDDGWNMVFTVCNFYTAGNYWNSYPYVSGGDVCSEDMQAGDTCENGLITPENYTVGLDYECDVNGDNLLGLEELIAALRVVTGAVQ